jgi:hypothetical protein
MEIKTRQQLLVIAAIAVLGLFAADKLVFDPLTAVWKAKAKRIQQLRTQIAQGQRLLQREGAIRGRWAQMERNTLTNNTSAAEQQLFGAIDSWRQECRMDASGNLPALSRFLYDIEKDPMALKLDSIEISSRDKEGLQLVLALQISGLVLTPPSR